MTTTQSAERDLDTRTAPETDSVETDSIEIEAPARERDGRAEIDVLRAEIEHLVRGDRDAPARDVVESALASVTRLQVATANLDACGPPSARFAGAILTALADERLHGHPDAIERGMTYTADNQIRLLQTPR